MFSKLTLFLLLAGLGLTICPLAWGQESDDAARYQELQTRIEKLVAQLGSEEFKLREAATKELLEIGNPARASLEQGARSADQETADRSQSILDQLPKLTHTLLDALGEPIPLARVTLRSLKELVGGQVGGESLLPVSTSLADGLGRVAIADVKDVSVQALLLIEHPLYGKARFELYLNTEEKTIRLPLVRKGSPAYARALTGQVVNPTGKPVVDAIIHGETVRTPGMGLINAVSPRGDVLTDSEGNFAYYLPGTDAKQERGTLIPVNSRYQIRVSVPENKDYFPLAGSYANTAAVRLELQQPTRFFRFYFEAVGGGKLEEPEQLRQVYLQLEQNQNGERSLITLDQGVVTQGSKLPVGKYIAQMYAKTGAVVHYLPVIVTAESPDELIFRLPPTLAYRGRVLHGVTGEPMKGAFVMGWNSTARNNLALLTADDWKALAELEATQTTDATSLKSLRQFYGVQMLTRTDSEGNFTLTRQPEHDIYGLLAFAEDFVPYKVTVGALKPNEQRAVEAGELPLFPAAKILVRPVFEGARLAVSPNWVLSEQEQPAWIDKFRAAQKNYERQLEYVHWLEMNETQPLYVPAGISLKVQFDSPYDDKWSPTSPDKTLLLKPGESLELGDLKFAACPAATVRVVDQAGKPVEGVPVRRKQTIGNAFSVAHNTDQNGKAIFHVHPSSTGEFRVTDLPGPADGNRAANLGIEFSVKDKSPTADFVITLTPEQIQLLRGEKK